MAISATVAEQLGQAASAFEQQSTGHAPRSVTVVLSEDTLVLTLHGALSPAERALARSPAGAAQVREFHRQLFANFSGSLRQEIQRITGTEVREATAEVETNTGTVVKVFTTGTAVQVFLFGRSLAARGGSGSESATRHEKGVSTMLILSRKTQESVVVGGSEGFEQLLKVTVLDIRRGYVRLGFEAEAGIPVHRSEVWERIQAEGGPEKPSGEDVAPVA